MRVLLQRVSQASVRVGNREVSRIGRGYLLLAGIHESDGEDQARWLAAKIATLRVFEDSSGRFNLSIKDVEGEILVVSQFTLYGDSRKGRRPSFTHAAAPELAEPLCNRFSGFLRDEGLTVRQGVFGARMSVSLVNDGPVTLMLEREPTS